MKMTPRQYARILGVMTETYANDTQTIVEKFVFLLRRNRHAVMFSKIALEFDALAEKRSGGETVRLQTARAFSEEVQKKVERDVRRVRKNDSVKIFWGRNERLTGGVRMQWNEFGRDESVARRFQSLKAHMSGRE